MLNSTYTCYIFGQVFEDEEQQMTKLLTCLSILMKMWIKVIDFVVSINNIANISHSIL